MLHGHVFISLLFGVRLQQMMPQQPSPSGKPTGSDSTTPHGTNRGDNLAGSQAAAPPGDDKGDNQECLQKTLSQDRETNSNRKSSQNHLQKTLSQNSETNSESDQDDYHKMTAGGDADNNVRKIENKSGFRFSDQSRLKKS